MAKILYAKFSLTERVSGHLASVIVRVPGKSAPLGHQSVEWVTHYQNS